MVFIKKNRLYCFRRYKKYEGNKTVRHPKLIVDEKSDEYGYMGLTHQPKRGHHSNIPLYDNPEIFYLSGKIIRKKEKSYLRDNIEYDKKNNFDDPLDNFVLSDRDRISVVNYVEYLMHKKKK